MLTIVVIPVLLSQSVWFQIRVNSTEISFQSVRHRLVKDFFICSDLPCAHLPISSILAVGEKRNLGNLRPETTCLHQ